MTISVIAVWEWLTCGYLNGGSRLTDVGRELPSGVEAASGGVISVSEEEDAESSRGRLPMVTWSDWAQIAVPTPLMTRQASA